MSDQQPHFPPPGHRPESEASTPAPPPVPATPMPPAVASMGPAFRPGAFPLRPLTLGAMYDGAFRIIRYNPKATVGAAALVTAVAMVVPVVVTLVVETTLGTGFSASGEVADDLSTREAVGLIASAASLLLGILAAQLGLIFVTGMIAHVTRAAAVGRQMSLAEAWAATHGARWRLLGLALLIGAAWTLFLTVLVGVVVAVAIATGDPLITVLVGLVVGVLAVCLGVWLWVRVTYLAGAALMLETERAGVFRALGRSWTLTDGAFWRTFGIAILTVLVTSFAGGLLTTPLSIGGQLGAVLVPQYTFAFLAGTQALVLVVQNAFVAPFAAAVSSVQYLDLRIRKEGYDVELMREAGVLPR